MGNEQPKDKKEQHAIRWSFLRRDPSFLYPLRRLFDPPGRLLGRFMIKDGQGVADLACGWGYYTFPLAERVGPQGKVYAVDLGAECIHSIQKKAARGGYQNIEAHATSAADLQFIQDGSLDFVFANGLLCCMEYDRSRAVQEIQRVLKPGCQAYLSLGSPPPMGYVDQAEWEQILANFQLDGGGSFKELWALVSVKLAAS